MKRRRYYQHPHALVESQQIGKGTRVWAFAHVMRGAMVGRNCNIGEGCFLEAGVRVGDNVTIKNGCMLWDGVTIEDGAFIGPGVIFTNDVWPRSSRLPEAAPRYLTRSWLEPTRVGRGATIGAGAILRAGVEIGEFAAVAMGAIVTRSVRARALAVGVPARRTGWVCHCGLRLATEKCAGCGRGYKILTRAARALTV